MMRQVSRCLVWLLLCGMIGVSFPGNAVKAQVTAPAEEAAPDEERQVSNSPAEEGSGSSDYPERSYLFIHDTSLNMRRKQRIPLMQASIRKILENIPLNSKVGLRAFGHRFSVDGPDACTDTDMVIPFDTLNRNREDFETQLNLLKFPPIGGGAPVGLALQQGIADMRDFPGQKEIILYMVDLQKCPDDHALETITSACSVEDLHLSLVGIGLKRDLITLERANVGQLECVDIMNILTPDEAQVLPEKLLTRISIEFRNAEGELMDPAPGENLVFKLFRENDEEKLEVIREKTKTMETKGSSIETVGLEEGTYFVDVSYQGQKLRSQKAITLNAKDEFREVIQLGKMLVSVTDSQGNLIEDPQERHLKITLTDAGKIVRTIEHASQTAFDLLPGNHYNVLISYMVGGVMQSVEYDTAVTIHEGNHQYVSIQLPVGSVKGNVLDMTGAPKEGVEVRLSGPEDDAQQEFSLTTDEQGTYFFPDLDHGEYTLWLHAPEYKPVERRIEVVGGKVHSLEELELFHGIETIVTSVSGAPIPDAEVSIVNTGTSEEIPVERHEHVYRNAQTILPGDYRISVTHDAYQSKTQEVTFQEESPFLDVPFQLAYSVTVKGSLVNGKGAPLSGVAVSFTHNAPTLPQDQLPVRSELDGTFETQILVSQDNEEMLALTWFDRYNQAYTKDMPVSLPTTPQTVELGKIRLPVNFLQMSLQDVTGAPVTADTVAIYHEQSGQSGIHVNLLQQGKYESTALLDGDYTVRVIKRGYQEIEHTFQVAEGRIHELSLTMHNYITVAGTVTDGKNNRIPNATITFDQLNSAVTSLQPVTTGKDGRFQATLLVKKAAKEHIEIRWESSASHKTYQAAADFHLQGNPITEYQPMNLGNYQLPANFVRIEVHDVAGKGLPGAVVAFISSQGKETRAIELGDGIYESLDLYDGYYNATIAKKGYKENVIISDVTVGKGQREVSVGPVVLPHYATVRGTVLNGRDQGVPNVEITFDEQASEQLERCRTDQDGHFSTTVLVTGASEEQWQATWKRPEFRASGNFFLPIHPDDSANIGEIRIPANAVSLPVEDIQGRELSGVRITITDQENTPVTIEDVLLEEVEPGLYQIVNLPDGSYNLLVHKEQYEQLKQIELTVEGGRHYALDPVQLGYYVNVKGRAVNGKRERLSRARLTFRGLHSKLVPEERRTAPAESVEGAEEVSASEQMPPVIVTNDRGEFSATLLVTSLGYEHVVVTWNDQYSSSYRVNLAGGPGIREMDMQLPINFIRVHLENVAQTPLNTASVSVTHQVEHTMFLLQEISPGVYESQGLPDGNYSVAAEKDHYESQRITLSVKGGELKQTAFRLNHYTLIKGYITNGKEEGVSAATVKFKNLKSTASEKAISGTDGAFEARLLIEEPGKESATITWVGNNDTYTKSLWFDLPLEPGELSLPRSDTRLPINYISLEVKSVAATGISGATVTVTHRESELTIEARDNDNGNYEAGELPDGTYDILVSKDRYEDVKLENITVAGGEHTSDVLVSRFPHYITISGVILNGKDQGVANARVAIQEPTRVKQIETFITRKDGSFTIQTIVTDIGTETLEVSWNDRYSTTLPVQLPSVPDHIRVEPVKLPINFIVVTVRDVYGKHIPEATVSYIAKEQGTVVNPDQVESQLFRSPIGTEIAHGVYESPDLTDDTYIIVVKKEGYIQSVYPEVSVGSGITESNTIITLPHLVTVNGQVLNGKGEGVQGVKVLFEGRNSRTSSAELFTDEDGYFTETLQVIGTGPETLTLVKSGFTDRPEDQFELSQEFELLHTPDEYQFEELRLPINFIPIRVEDVSGQPIADAEILLFPTQKEDSQQAPHEPFRERPFRANSSLRMHIANVGNGQYEGRDLQDGAYLIAVKKEGYQSQQRTVSVSSGEIAPEIVFTLPHYVVVRGVVLEGKGNGVPDALLEFDPQNSELTPLARIEEAESPDSQGKDSHIRTDINGQFTARLLVKNVGIQRVRASWNTRYVKQFFFTLPETPSMNYTLADPIRLPINCIPFRVTNVLGDGLAGAEISLQKTGKEKASALIASALGGGYYEARELLDGVYTMTIQKEGYQETSGDISVNGGEQTPEQGFSLPHFVTVQGTIINDKGIGAPNAKITIAGLNSRRLHPEEPVRTAEDGSFSIELLVTGSESEDLQEHLEVSWNAPADSLAANTTNGQGIPFGISHDFHLPATPGAKNLGLLRLPANFFPVMVQDISGKGLSGVTVQFIDENERIFTAREFTGGFYEGQNLPNGVYTIQVSKGGYREDYRKGITIAAHTSGSVPSKRSPLTFQLPYYVDIKGTTVNGKGQELIGDISLELAETHSQLVPGTVRFDQEGNFKATLLISETGTEHLHLSWSGEHGVHGLDVPVFLPDSPQTIDLHRLSLPINFIPVEIKDLLGHGIDEVTVTLRHLETETEIAAVERGQGLYEGQHLPDGTYEMTVSKEGYKPERQELVTVEKGMVSPMKTFRLQHYVWITGRVTNGEGEGVRDPLIELKGRCSRNISEHSDITGRFEVQLEVQEAGSEQITFSWKNRYRTSVFFTLPGQPQRTDLGEIRLPINFLSVLVTDISGSTLRDVQVNVEADSGVIQTLKTDQNGVCHTDDLPNDTYTVSVKKDGYRTESRNVQVRDGRTIAVRFTLPHYVIVKGRVRDIMQKAVGEANVIFEEFTNQNGQKIRTATDPATGEFKQQLLINDAAFLERQKGHFTIQKGETEQYFTFKIPTEPNHIVNYKTLLFPTTYFKGKVVDADVRTIPLDNARIFLSPVNIPSASSEIPSGGDAENQLLLTTNSLGMFEMGGMKRGEYKITIQKDGYEPYEDFVHISGLLHEQKFLLRKK